MVVLVGCRCRLRFLFRKSSHIVHRGFITVEESARRNVVSAGLDPAKSIRYELLLSS